MRLKWPLSALFVALAFSYAALPYVTLFRLGQAVRAGDAATLEALVDWPSVREGIKEDICDLAIDDGTPHGASVLPAFGASFIRGIAVNSIDKHVTSAALVAAVRAVPERWKTPKSASGLLGGGRDLRIDWAFFAGIKQFTVTLRSLGVDDPIQMDLELRHGSWQVRRVWLPAALLSGSAART